MPVLTSPRLPPYPERGDDEVRPWLRLRLTQVAAALATILATAWLCMLGPIPAIIALLFAKHILVAILLMGLGMGDVRR